MWGGQVRLLVCSDAMARGMDLPAVETVVNYDAPPYVKTYIHRPAPPGRPRVSRQPAPAVLDAADIAGPGGAGPAVRTLLWVGRGWVICWIGGRGEVHWDAGQTMDC